MKVIEVITDLGHVDTILSIAEQFDVADIWHFKAEQNEKYIIRLLVSNNNIQAILDSIQKIIGSSKVSRLIVLPVEATLPIEAAQGKPKISTNIIETSREALYQTIEQNARLNQNYILLVLLSTIVAAVGMLENNIAVVIGAMVIAPLLGPNIALAFGTVLADSRLMLRASITLLVGILLALSTSLLLTYFYPALTLEKELLDRTVVNISSIVLALASGAAAVLSMTSGLSSVLVGVMVAVAILPPTAAIGLMLGYQNYPLAYGAFILLAVNIVCINLSANIVFLFKGIRPRKQGEKQKARKTAFLYLLLWLLLLVTLLIVLLG